MDMKGELDEERRKNSTLTEEIEQLKVQLSKEVKVILYIITVVRWYTYNNCNIRLHVL